MPSVPQKVVMEKLKQYKEKHNLSLDELASKLNVTAGAISFWLNGKSGLSYYSFCKIQDLLEEDGIFLYG